MKKLILLGLVVAILLGGYHWIVPNPKRVSHANYEKIRRGMTQAQVRSTLGRPYAFAGTQGVSSLDQMVAVVFGRLDKAKDNTITKEIEATCQSIQVNERRVTAPPGSIISSSLSLDRNSVAGDVDITIFAGRQTEVAPKTFQYSKTGEIHLSVDSGDYSGTLEYEKHAFQGSERDQPVQVLTDGKINFRYRNASLWPTVDGSLLMWRGEDSRAIYVVFNPNITFMAYQGRASDFPNEGVANGKAEPALSVPGEQKAPEMPKPKAPVSPETPTPPAAALPVSEDALRAQVTAQVDHSFPCGKVGDAIELRKLNGITYNGIFKDVNDTGISVLRGDQVTSILFVDLAPASRIRVDKVYRETAISSEVLKKVGGAK